MTAGASLPVGHFAKMDHGRLASLSANQAAEISRLLRERDQQAFALHRRRLEVAYLRFTYGLRVDTACMAAWRQELEAEGLTVTAEAER